MIVPNFIPIRFETTKRLGSSDEHLLNKKTTTIIMMLMNNSSSNTKLAIRDQFLTQKLSSSVSVSLIERPLKERSQVKSSTVLIAPTRNILTYLLTYFK